MIFTPQQDRIVEYCAREVERQSAPAIEVYYMFQAWQYLTVMVTKVDIDTIRTLGKLVDPVDNANGFRTYPALLPDGPAMSHGLILNALGRAVRLSDGTSEYANWFYRYFEEIHPFHDGNGRAGSLLFNYFNGTIQVPETPPNYWDTTIPENDTEWVRNDIDSKDIYTVQSYDDDNGVVTLKLKANNGTYWFAVVDFNSKFIRLEK